MALRKNVKWTDYLHLCNYLPQVKYTQTISLRLFCPVIEQRKVKKKRKIERKCIFYKYTLHVPPIQQIHIYYGHTYCTLTQFNTLFLFLRIFFSCENSEIQIKIYYKYIKYWRK